MSLLLQPEVGCMASMYIPNLQLQSLQNDLNISFCLFRLKPKVTYSPLLSFLSCFKILFLYFFSNKDFFSNWSARDFPSCCSMKEPLSIICSSLRPLIWSAIVLHTASHCHLWNNQHWSKLKEERKGQAKVWHRWQKTRLNINRCESPLWHHCWPRMSFFCCRSHCSCT